MDTLSIIAHRGASGIVGEDNTLRACQHAIVMGCDMVEVDIHQTADEQLICFHDSIVGGDKISQLTYEALQERWSQSIPTLQACLDICAGHIALDIEIKNPGYEGAVLELLSHYDIDDQVSIKSFRAPILAKLRQLQCPYPIGYLIPRCPEDTDRQVHLEQHAPDQLPCAIDFVGPHYELIDDEFFELFPQLPCFPWTINDPAEMRRLSQFAIHGIITDRPDLAQLVLRREIRPISRDEIQTALSSDQEDQLIARLQYRRLSQDASIDSRSVHFCADFGDELKHWITAAWGADAQVCFVHDACFSSPRLDALRANFEHCFVLNKIEPFTHLTPHDQLANELAAFTQGFDGIIAFGSGTVNDICKYAAAKNGMEYISCATAASMNGYTSSIAALLLDNLKSTIPCTPPIAVLIDEASIQSAPAALAQSGFADLLSKYVSLSDWKLSNIIRGDAFDDMPGRIANSAIERIKSLAPGIPAGEAEASTLLMQAIILSGFSMSLAGSSAPASGGEHLISHYLDMSAYQAQRCPALHGEQVALGTLLSSRLYEVLRRADPQTLTPRLYTSDELAAAHGPLWPIIQSTAEAQLISEDQAQQRLQHIQKNWDKIWHELDQFLTSHADISTALQSAEVACHPRAYQIDDSLMRRAFLHAADIRDRYTVLHFARDCGMLETVADEVLSSAFSA